MPADQTKRSFYRRLVRRVRDRFFPGFQPPASDHGLGDAVSEPFATPRAQQRLAQHLLALQMLHKASHDTRNLPQGMFRWPFNFFIAALVTTCPTALFASLFGPNVNGTLTFIGFAIAGACLLTLTVLCRVQKAEQESMRHKTKDIAWRIEEALKLLQ